MKNFKDGYISLFLPNVVFFILAKRHTCVTVIKAGIFFHKCSLWGLQSHTVSYYSAKLFLVVHTGTQWWLIVLLCVYVSARNDLSAAGVLIGLFEEKEMRVFLLLLHVIRVHVDVFLFLKLPAALPRNTQCFYCQISLNICSVSNAANNKNKITKIDYINTNMLIIAAVICCVMYRQIYKLTFWYNLASYFCKCT